jgi:hypothetical protein
MARSTTIAFWVVDVARMLFFHRAANAFRSGSFVPKAAIRAETAQD